MRLGIQRFSDLSRWSAAAAEFYLCAPVSGRLVIALTEGGTGLEYVSCLVGGTEALERMGAKIENQGIAVSETSQDARTGAKRALRLMLPTQQGLEFMVPAAEDGSTGPSKLPYPGAFDIEASHVQLRTPDVAGLAEFFGKVGFRTTDYGKMRDSGEYFAAFVRANEFHHQFALFNGKLGLHHIALETDTIDVLRLGDHLRRLRVSAEYGPGRHKPGDSIFMYVRDPFGNRIEITSPMQMVGFEQPAQQLTDPFPFLVNMWGPQPPESWLNEWT